MITTAGYNVAFFLISSIINFFPAGTGFSDEIHNAITILGQYFSVVDPLVPIDTLVAVLTLTFTIEIAFFGWRTIKYLIGHVPAIGGNG